jgi:hypothetical protein
MSAALSQASFAAALDTEFHVRPLAAGDGAPLALRLVEVKTLPAPPGYEQFSALFAGPAEPIWAQGTYRFTHPQMGDVALFMVPLGPMAGAARYEVCISREATA